MPSALSGVSFCSSSSVLWPLGPSAGGVPGCCAVQTAVLPDIYPWWLLESYFRAGFLSDNISLLGPLYLSLPRQPRGCWLSENTKTTQAIKQSAFKEGKKEKRNLAILLHNTSPENSFVYHKRITNEPCLPLAEKCNMVVKVTYPDIQVRTTLSLQR